MEGRTLMLKLETHEQAGYICCLFQLMNLYTLKHQLTLIFKTLKKLLKKHFSKVTATCFGPLIRPSSGSCFCSCYVISPVGRQRFLLLHRACC